MAFGLRDLASAVDKAGTNVPRWVVEALKQADEDDVLKRLVEDACRGVELGLYIPEIPVRLFGRKILTLGPIRIWLSGFHQPKEGEQEAKPESAVTAQPPGPPTGTAE